jgi:hypothetical protein
VQVQPVREAHDEVIRGGRVDAEPAHDVVIGRHRRELPGVTGLAGGQPS